MHERIRAHDSFVLRLIYLHAGYLRLSTDICDIKESIGTSDNPDYAPARKIYNDGKNSYKSDGTIRTLRGEDKHRLRN
jgi:hypothetical protein